MHLDGRGYLEPLGFAADSHRHDAVAIGISVQLGIERRERAVENSPQLRGRRLDRDRLQATLPSSYSTRGRCCLDEEEGRPRSEQPTGTWYAASQRSGTVDSGEQSSSDWGRDWERCTRCGTTRFVCAGAGGCPTSLPDGASSLPSWSRSSSSPSDRGSSRSIDRREGGPTRLGEGHSAPGPSGQCYAFSSFVGRRRAATRPMSPNAARTIIATA